MSAPRQLRETDDIVGVVAEALHYFGAHNPHSPRHAAWVALDTFLGPAEPLVDLLNDRDFILSQTEEPTS